MDLISRSIDITKLEEIYLFLRSAIGREYGVGVQLLAKDKVEKWILRPGMEFGSSRIWWGDTSKSRQEAYGGADHEGIDFALGKLHAGGTSAGMEETLVPIFLQGEVQWVFKDLVGDTVIVLSGVEIGDFRLIFQYSHIVFDEQLLGSKVEQGQKMGKIKFSDNPKSITASHLHLSLALLKKDCLGLSNDEVDFNSWIKWADDGDLIFIDPLQVIDPVVRDSFFVQGESAAARVSLIAVTSPEKEDRLTVRRRLARAFPGTRVVPKKTNEDALSLLLGAEETSGIVVRCEGEAWSFLRCQGLSVSESLACGGEGFAALLSAIWAIEETG